VVRKTESTLLLRVVREERAPCSSGFAESVENTLLLRVVREERAHPAPQGGERKESALLLRVLWESFENALLLTMSDGVLVPKATALVPANNEGKVGWVVSTAAEGGRWWCCRTMHAPAQPANVVQPTVDSRSSSSEEATFQREEGERPQGRGSGWCMRMPAQLQLRAQPVIDGSAVFQTALEEGSPSCRDATSG